MPESLPRHLAVIMDGNGRWAKKRGMPRVMGHRKGVEVVKDIALYSAEVGISYLSLFAFSMENWKRPGDEVGFLMRLLDDYIERELETILSNNIRLTASGRMALLPEGTRKKLEAAIERSSSNGGMVLNLALSYGGRSEIIDVARRMAEEAKNGTLQPEDIDEEFFKSYLYNPEIPDVDLLIRTSGEMRISNFQLWRIAYSELYFTDKYWPDFSRADLDEAVQSFAGRERRFGKTTDQIDSPKSD
ncbi:isoprenyl transferase [Limisalsivibrio acetivorans]|uniref:isoprenyl transferase n=1 Tax=Limisalsivibrio acetivorans TaxID=1304888 RepID=UPI0003B79D4A|nr:isoprenyl transferase [Limisalsivibrio acetivorans]